MAGRVPAIHVFFADAVKTWMPGTGPGTTEFCLRDFWAIVGSMVREA
jgi:hypothetical protein